MLLESELKRWGVAKLALLLALLAGCTAAPTADRPALSGKWEIAMTDSCGKLAGFLAMAELFEINASSGERDFRVEVETEMEKRCPDDVKPEALDIAFSIPTTACAELRGILAMADAFGMMATLPRDKREIADKLVDDLDAEIEKRCPALE